MKIKHALLSSIAALATVPAHGLTLEELAARLEKLEKKVGQYEAQYGPLNDTPVQSESVSRSNAIPMPTPIQEPALAPATAADIDASYLNAPIGAGGNWFDRTSIGGYGELHLNQGDKEQIDFHRFVLFFNHRFSERVKLFTELELEHSLAGDGKPGEVELEQAYIEFGLDNDWYIRAGQYLLPLGILNEVHEPETFYGVERNNVEANIIPTTWWEGGVMVSKNLESGLGFDLGVHSGLAVSTDASSSDAFRIRSGRQKVAEASASDYAASARVRYSGVPGLSLTGFANYQNDIAPDSEEDNSALLLGGSAVFQKGGFGLRALIAHWDIEGQSFEDNDADSQWGYYIEPSYRWTFGDQAVGIFGRYSHYEYARSAGNTRGGEFDEYTLGVNYWPVPNVVLKADFTQIEQDGAENNETFNFGLGYSF
jgi:hypothetical protein